MTAIADHLKHLSSDLTKAAEVIEALEKERDFYRRQALQWAEVVDRQECSFAERVQLDALMAAEGK